MRYGLVALLGLGMSFAQTMKYPAPKKGDVVDDYHGTKIADPYRWLEDTDSPETAQWVAEENRLTREYFTAVPQRAIGIGDFRAMIVVHHVTFFRGGVLH